MIVIIGAGLAGLAAGQKLIEANRTNFIIVEAQDYVGGRIKTTYLEDGTRLDLGAHWLYGGKANPIYKWLKRRNLLESLGDEEMDHAGLFATQRGELAPMHILNIIRSCCVIGKQIQSEMAESFCPFLKPANHFKGALVHGAKTSCWQDYPREEDRAIVWAAERWYELCEAIDNSCLDFDDLSDRAYRGWIDSARGKYVKLHNCWQNVISHMKESIGREKILLNSPVDRVEYSQKSARVTLANGRVIECDHVLITIPVGPLNKLISKRDSFIVPELSKSRKTLIERIGFGPVAKIYLQFERPFLQEEKSFRLLWTDHHNPTADLPAWTRGISSFDVVPGSPNLLLVSVGCKGALEVDKWSDSKVGETCLKVLKTFLPRRQIPTLISTTKSNWSANEYIGGAYSHPSIRGDIVDTRQMWDPICVRDGPKLVPRVLFAGEATAGEMYSTAHGAIVSGWREADRLLKLSSPTTRAAT